MFSLMLNLSPVSQSGNIGVGRGGGELGMKAAKLGFPLAQQLRKLPLTVYFVVPDVIPNLEAFSLWGSASNNLNI